MGPDSRRPAVKNGFSGGVGGCGVHQLRLLGCDPDCGLQPVVRGEQSGQNSTPRTGAAEQKSIELISHVNSGGAWSTDNGRASALLRIWTWPSRCSTAPADMPGPCRRPGRRPMIPCSRPQPTVAFGQRDQRMEGFDDAQQACWDFQASPRWCAVPGDGRRPIITDSW